MRRWPVIAAACAALLMTGCSYSGGGGYETTGSPSPQMSNTEATSSSSCGVERWAVKTGTDPGAASIDLANPMPASVDALVHFLPPGPHADNSRVVPIETTEYQLTAILKEYKIEADQDVHMVFEDRFGNHMIAELPSPGCVGDSSPWKAMIASARLAFNTQFNPATSWKQSGKTVTITGIGFFDAVHGQTGVAGGPGITKSNGIEIHPVLEWSLGG